MELPDVIGFTLDEALSEIRDKGFFVDKVLVTKPVKATEPLGTGRVVRLLLIDEVKVQVIVAHQDYEKGGVQYGI
ncbi:MAG: PASTA domain-containing protein [Eubacteriales bacterium]|nr:MAG: hypothetical protein CVV03_02305 [Firmicutes bacterium HGW-Firmicutes-8]